MKRRYKFLIGILIFCLFYYVVYSTDEDKPDTFANKQFFKDMLDMDVPEGVTELYCYSNNVGLDGSSQMKFQCDSNTVHTIAEHMGLSKANAIDNAPYGIWTQLPGWDIERIQTIVPFVKKDESRRMYWYLWYDQKNQTAYYIYFDV
ncbi:MAG TPA: hypothetical protein VK796_05965 [Cytophaga sp.]|jgi:hypothetical protein|nr:hypothetical protein [Cytophaga sp.]